MKTNKTRLLVITTLILIILVLTISGCKKDTFRVDYKSEYSSSAGTRKLDITYDVDQGKVVGCAGNYTTMMTDGTKVSPCDVRRLLDKGYNVPIELVTESSKRSGTDDKGYSSYEWKIIDWE